jgi:uncharacterized protein with HEPN domain
MPSTRSKQPIDALADILHNIQLATDFTEGMSYEVFRSDMRTVYAVTRCLEIISEASRRLPKQLKARHADISWTDIAGAGSVYRHSYEDVLERIRWETLQHGLGPLKAVVEEELRRLEAG